MLKIIKGGGPAIVFSPGRQIHFDQCKITAQRGPKLRK
jgi:hypothetical protein